MDEEKTLDTAILANLYIMTLENALKQQYLTSKVWAIVSLGMWGGFFGLGIKAVLVGMDWLTFGGLLVMLSLSWIFTNKIAPIQTDYGSRTQAS